MNLLHTLTSGLNKLVLNILVLMFLFMTVAVVYQVISRYVTAQSAPWTEEYARYLFVYVALLGSSVALKTGGHVAVSLLTDRLNAVSRHRVAIFATLVAAGFFGVMVYSGYYSMVRAAMQSSPATDTNLGLIYAAVPVSGALMLLYSVEMVLDLLLQGPQAIGSTDATDSGRLS